MPSLSHPDLAVATVGDHVDEGDVVPHDLNVVEDDVVNEGVLKDNSRDTSGISEASSAVCSDKGRPCPVLPCPVPAEVPGGVGVPGHLLRAVSLGHGLQQLQLSQVTSELA
jgi:hypothetical protein